MNARPERALDVSASAPAPPSAVLGGAVLPDGPTTCNTIIYQHIDSVHYAEKQNKITGFVWLVASTVWPELPAAASRAAPEPSPAPVGRPLLTTASVREKMCTVPLSLSAQNSTYILHSYYTSLSSSQWGKRKPGAGQESGEGIEA